MVFHKIVFPSEIEQNANALIYYNIFYFSSITSNKVLGASNIGSTEIHEIINVKMKIQYGRAKIAIVWFGFEHNALSMRYSTDIKYSTAQTINSKSPMRPCNLLLQS